VGGHRHFDRMILTAPMIGLPFIGSSALVRAASRAMRVCGLGTSYIPGGRRTIMDARPFAGNRRTSDPGRYARNAAIVVAEPSLGMGSPTIAWTDAALEAMHEFADTGYPAKIRERTLIVAPPGRDCKHGRKPDIRHPVGSGRPYRHCWRQARAVDGAGHYRAQFWSAFDSSSG
jgi:lysophospholipase